MPQPLLTLSLTAAVLFTAAAAQAQVYRVLGPDGRVSYSDSPPAASAREAPVRSSSTSAPTGTASLPYALNQTAQRYPVTLYTGSDCTPCASGRNLLINRGIPFTERTVNSNADITALQRQFGDSSLPVLTVGTQQLKGYSDSEWTQYLSAAGYPQTSQLPSSYRRPAATPLAATQAAPAAANNAADTAASPATETPAAPSVAPARTSTNPAGIRF